MVALIPFVRYFGATTSEPVLHVRAALSHVLPRVASKRVEELSCRHDGVHALVMNLWIVRLRIAFKGWHTALLERQIESAELRSGVREHLVERGILEHGAEPLVVVGSALCEGEEAIDAQCHSRLELYGGAVAGHLFNFQFTHSSLGAKGNDEAAEWQLR